MQQNAVFSLSRQLFANVLAQEALLSEGRTSTDFLVKQLRKKGKILAEDLKAAFEQPQSIKAYSPWNGIDRS